MRLALVSDIHGNLPAFEAVVDDLRKQAPDHVAFLGDISFNGLYPQECFDLLMSLRPVCMIKGNTDSNFEELAEFVPSNDFERKLYDMIAYGDVRLTAEAKATIKSWPIFSEREIAGCKIGFCHGSPWNFKDHFSPSNPAFTDLAEKVKKLQMNAIFCGHTHRRETFRIDDTLVVNVGAVGYSFDGDPRPSYCIADIDGGQVSCDMRRIDYDSTPYRRQIMENSLFDSLGYILANGLVPER